jgi:hypothetical protein
MLALIAVNPAAAAPPSNDDFSSAEPFSLPLNATVDITEATTEFNEPQVCWFMDRTVWYTITPDQNRTVHVDTFGSAIGANINVYQSTSPGISNLNFLGCASSNNSPSFFLEAGQTYYLQAGSIFGEPGNIQVNVEEFVPPPPQADFVYFPSDPMPLENMSFCDTSFDPAGFGFNSYTWDFGDGATSTVNCASHQYAADGDYTVQHSATTPDGRTAFVSKVVSVRTHDVSIMRVMAPTTARVGQSRSITVSIKNTRYPDNVRIELFRSTPNGGFEFIASSTQFVPVRSGNRTTEFNFNYTFSPQDAQVGKVTFRVIVTLVNARDAFPADNEAFSTPPTKVSG